MSCRAAGRTFFSAGAELGLFGKPASASSRHAPGTGSRFRASYALALTDLAIAVVEVVIERRVLRLVSGATQYAEAGTSCPVKKLRARTASDSHARMLVFGLGFQQRERSGTRSRQ